MILVTFYRIAVYKTLSMPASEYTNTATRDIFQFVRNENTRNELAGIKRKKI